MKPSSGEAGSNKAQRLSADAASFVPVPLLGPDVGADAMPQAGASGGGALCAEDDDEEDDEMHEQCGVGAEAHGAAVGSEAAQEDDHDGDTEDGRDRVRLGSAARRCGPAAGRAAPCAPRAARGPVWRRAREKPYRFAHACPARRPPHPNAARAR
jgi:hypothetical protein